MNQKFIKTTALLSCTFIVFSCSKKDEKPTEEKSVENVQTTDTITTKIPLKTDTIAFDITTMPLSNTELGEFPFLVLPKNIKFQNKPLLREYDEIFFPLGPSNNFVKIGGKSFKTYLVKSDDSATDWSLPYFEKMYDEAITKLGGKLIYEGKATDQQTNFLKENARYLGEEGSIDYWGGPYRVYAIRRTNGDDIFIQLYGNTASGAIQILQKEPSTTK